MKIIAETSEGVLIAATKSEVAHLLGEWSQHSDKFRSRSIGIGMTVDVVAMYERLRRQEQARETLQNHARSLRAIASLMDAFQPVVAALSEDLPAEKAEGSQP